MICIIFVRSSSCSSLISMHGLPNNSGAPNNAKIGSFLRDKFREIAEMKLKDLNTTNIEAAMRTIEGTAGSMGLTSEIW